MRQLSLFQIQVFIHSIIYSSFYPSILSSFHSFIHSFIHSPSSFHSFMHSFILLPIHSSINDMGSDNAKISISCFLVEIVQGGGVLGTLLLLLLNPALSRFIILRIDTPTIYPRLVLNHDFSCNALCCLWYFKTFFF